MKLPEIEITIKYKGHKKSELKKICSSADIYEVLREMYNADIIDWQEQMILICLNQSNKVIGWKATTESGLYKIYSIKTTKTPEKAFNMAKKLTSDIITITGLLIHAETKPVLIN